MKNRSSNFIFGLILLASLCFITCENPFIDKWWDDKTVTTSFFTVKFEANGGSPVPEAQIIIPGQKAVQPGLIEKEYVAEEWTDAHRGLYGTEFKCILSHWCTDEFCNYINEDYYNIEDCPNKWNFSTDIVESDLTLYAVWELLDITDKYSVSFNTNGGITEEGSSYIQDQYLYVGELIQEPGEIKRQKGLSGDEWYDLVGWFTVEGVKWDFDNDTMPERNIILHAGWIDNNSGIVIEDPATYIVVTFVSNGGSEVSPQIIAANGYIEEPPEPVRDGYIFVGWFFDDNIFRYEFDITKPVSNQDLTLYAKWQQSNTYFIVTFETNGGIQRVLDQYIIAGQLIQRPPTITRPKNLANTEWYDLVGWFTVEGAPWDFDNNKMPEQNITLHAMWTDNNEDIEIDDPETYVIVTFVSNGGSEVSPQIIAANGYIEEPPEPTRDGYDFEGWFTNASLQNEWDFDLPVSNQNLTLYAKWQKVITSFYTASFDVNGGFPNVPSQSLSAGALIQKPIPVYKLVGSQLHVFTGWHTVEGELWDFDNDTMPERNITLYAMWSFGTSASIMVTFVTNGGEELSPMYLKAGDRIIPPIITRDGYTFEGWFTTPELRYEFNFSLPVSNEDLTLYAKWQKVITYYTVTFDINGGFPYVPDQSLSAGDLIQEPGQMYKQIDSKWYDFTGWYTVEGELWNFALNTMPDGNITLHAVWRETAGATVMVTFVSNGGTEVSPQIIAANGYIEEPPEPAKDGYIFDGWFTSVSLQSKWDFGLTVPNVNLTLYAKWVEDTEYENGKDSFCFVIFDSNGGTPQPRVVRVNVGAVIGRLQPITRGNDGFVGWFYNGDEGEIEWDVETKPVTKDYVNSDGFLFLTAKWEPYIPETPTVFTVTFDTNSIYSDTAIPDQLIALGGKIVQPVVPKPRSTGHGFDGWYDNLSYTGVPWDFNTPVTQNMTLYAKWHSSFRVVRFEANGGTRPGGSKELTHEFAISTTYGIVPDPGPLVKDGYSFGGWYEEPSFDCEPWDFVNDRVTEPSPPAPDLILYARWVAQSRMVIFDANGGTDTRFPVIEYYPVGSKLTNPGAPSREGYTFLGWFKDPACTSGNGANFTTYTVPEPDGITGNEPIYIYAKWMSRQIYVAFEIRGPGPQTGQQAYQYVEYGQLATRPIITPPADKFFDGKWFKELDCINEWDFDNDRVTPVTSSMSLYGKYDPPPGWTVTFVLRNPPGGTSGIPAPPDQYITNGEMAIEPFMPPLPPPPLGVAETRYSFYRWETSRDGGNIDFSPYDFENTPVTGDLTLYARWVPPEPDMVWVPRGSFIMGDAGVSGSPAAYHAYPTRRVTLDGFYISRYLITQIDGFPLTQAGTGYRDIMGTNPSQFTGTTTRPVENVSWQDAMDYCDARSIRDNLTRPSYNHSTMSWIGDGYRLPTEAEWEYAAKGGFYWTDNFIYAGSNDPTVVAWYNETVKLEELGFRTTQTVGRKAPNRIGIYDMSGNLSEWCYDWFAPYNTLQGTGHNGTGPNPIGAASGTEKVRRGGAWNNAAGNVRVSVRNSEAPTAAHWAVGFRVVRGPSGIY